MASGAVNLTAPSYNWPAFKFELMPIGGNLVLPLAGSNITLLAAPPALSESRGGRGVPATRPGIEDNPMPVGSPICCRCVEGVIGMSDSHIPLVFRTLE
jgi:hypothetical protein